MNGKNIVMVVLDGARLDRLRNFPNFQKWTQKGTFFSKTITYGPQTVTSLHAIFTGVYGNKTKADNYFGSIKFKKKYFKTLSEYLHDNGFYTKGDVINEIVLPKEGFDSLTIHDEHKDDLAKKHNEMIREVSKLKENFFLYLHYSKVHTGMIDSVIKKYTDFDEVYFNNRENNIKNYDKYIKEADEYLGELLKTCQELDLFKDSIFIIFSDHGASVGEKKGERGYGRYCYDYTLKTFVSLIQPNIFPIKEVKKLSRTIDIMPTILDVLKIPEDDNYEKMQGKSLMPLIEDEPDERIAFSESAGVEEEPTNKKPSIKSIRTRRWKLIYNVDKKEKELYDLVEDPEENNNVFEKNPEIWRELFKELEKISPDVKEN